MRPIVKGTLPLALLLVLLYPVWSIMLRPDLDLWATDDGEAHLLRIYAMRLALGETLAFPRWIPDLYRGYGYPVFNFYAPLTYLAGHLAVCMECLPDSWPWGDSVRRNRCVRSSANH